MLYIIVNPISGRGRGAESIHHIQTLLDQRGVSFQLETTQYPGHATELAEQAVFTGCTHIVAAGGDGTIREVVTGLMQASRKGKRREGEAHRADVECQAGSEHQAGAKRQVATENRKGNATPPKNKPSPCNEPLPLPLPAFGVLTVGRGNDFAFGTGVLRKSPLEKTLAEEFDAILAGDTRPIDVGVYRLNGGKEQYFVNGLGIGIEPLINKTASKLKLRGVLSYGVAAVKVLIKLPKPYNLQVTCDTKQSYLQSQQLSVGNGPRMGGMFLMTPKSDPADGLLDFSGASHPVRWYEVITLVGKFLKGSQVEDKRILYSQHGRIAIESVDGKGFVCHADGDHLADNAQSLECWLLHHALRLMVMDE